jgi:hypothetical protein
VATVVSRWCSSSPVLTAGAAVAAIVAVLQLQADRWRILLGKYT